MKTNNTLTSQNIVDFTENCRLLNGDIFCIKQVAKNKVSACISTESAEFNVIFSLVQPKNKFPYIAIQAPKMESQCAKRAIEVYPTEIEKYLEIGYYGTEDYKGMIIEARKLALI